MLLRNLHRRTNGRTGGSDQECYQVARDLTRLEGCFVGISSGANVAAAIKLLKGREC